MTNFAATSLFPKVANEEVVLCFTESYAVYVGNLPFHKLLLNALIKASPFPGALRIVEETVIWSECEDDIVQRTRIRFC